MLATAVARHLATEIDALTFDTTGVTGNVFVARMPAQPDVAVMVMPLPGAGQPSLDPSSEPSIQTLIRGPEHDPRPGLILAEAIYNELQCLDLTVLDPGGADEVLVSACTCRTSGPAAMGPDANDRHEWSLTWDLTVDHPTTQRPHLPT